MALTDHWKYAEAGKAHGITLLSGIEYDLTGTDFETDVNQTFHVVSLCTERDPGLDKDEIKDTSVSVYLRVRKVVEAIRAAAAAAALDETITSFAQGYETMVGERGVTLSGGQKQRSAIARMLTQETPIMIFDDSLSAVDT